MKVLFIAYGFPPIQSSGTLRNQGFAEGLPQCGVGLRILCHSPVRQYSATSVLDPEWRDSPDWQEVCRFDWNAGTASTRVSRFCSRVPLLSTAVLRAQRAIVAARVFDAASQMLERESVDALYTSIAPPACVVAAVKLKSKFQLPLILDVRDPWSYAPPVPYRHYIDFWLERRFEKSLLAKCDRVVVPAHASADLLVSHLAVPRDRVAIIPNGYNRNDFQGNGKQSRHLVADTFNVVYAGEYAPVKPVGSGLKRCAVTALQQMGFFYDPLHCDRSARSLKWFLLAVQDAFNRDAAMRKKFRLHIYGADLRQSDEAVAAFPYPECLVFHGRIPSREAAQICSEADLLLLTQNHYQLDGKDCCVAIPAKLYTYLRAGRRILACVQPSEIRDVLEEAGAGSAVNPFDVRAIASEVMREFERWTHGQTDCNYKQGFDVTVFERQRQSQQLARLLHAVRPSPASSQALCGAVAAPRRRG